MTYKAGRRLICIGLLLLVAGCASAMKVQSVVPDLNIKKSDNLRQIKIAIEKFKLNAKGQDDNIIGEAKTGMFNAKTEIVSDEPASVIVTKAVKKGFEDSGFVLTDKRDADFIVNGVLEKFWVDEYATGLSLEYSKAYVRYDLIINKPEGAVIWANTVEIYKTSDKSLETTANDIPTLALALKESVESVFKDSSFWNAVTK